MHKLVKLSLVTGVLSPQKDRVEPWITPRCGSQLEFTEESESIKSILRESCPDLVLNEDLVAAY